MYAKERNSSELACGSQRKRLFEPESKSSFGRDLDFLAFSEHLRGASSCSARYCADCSTFAATGDRAQQRSQDRATANNFSGTAFLAYAAIVTALHIRRIHFVAMSVDADRLQSECHFRAPSGPASRYLAHGKPRISAFGNKYSAVRTRYRFLY